MSVDPMALVLRQLDRMERQQERIETKIDEKVDYRMFEEFKRQMEERTDRIEMEIEGITKAAVSPEQVTNLIDSGLKESQARGITARDRWIRWAVATGTLITTALLIYDRFKI
jgi:hypothetical protein